jgi:tetratricopeptide (TPR) repeat protein
MPSRRAFVLAVLLLASPLALAAQRSAGDPVALAKAGKAALDEHRYADALDAFAAASKLVPSDPGLCVAAGVAAFMGGQSADAEQWFTRALKINARDVNALEWLGLVQYREGRVSDAIATYEAALKQTPDDKDLQDRLESWRKDAQVEDSSYKANGAHFTVLFHGASDDALARRVVERLETEYFRIGAALNAYPERPITVVLYTDQQFRDVTRLPNWAGGAYDGRIRVPAQGLEGHPEEAGRVLAHEFVHAVVAMIGGRSVPTWLNEGLAVTFEQDGTEEAEQVLAATTERPSLKQLHASFATMTGAQARVAYALSAHAVHRIIELRGASAVVMLLQAISRGVPFSTAFYQCVAMPYDDFQALIARD